MPIHIHTRLAHRFLGPLARACDLTPDAQLMAALPPGARPRPTLALEHTAGAERAANRPGRDDGWGGRR